LSTRKHRGWLPAAAASLVAAAFLGALAMPGRAVAAGTPDHTVVLHDIRFNPGQISVKAGETIKFINKDPFDHDVFLVRAANRNVVIVPATTLAPGKSVTITLKESGLFKLYCTIHGGMTGLVSTTGSFELTDAEKKQFAHVTVIPPIVKTGEALFWGRAQCHNCHSIGDRGDGLRGPNLADIGFRSAMRAKKLGLDSGTDYIVQSIEEPSAYIVEGYSNDMPRVYQTPINLSADDLTAVVTYLQSQGGEVDTWSIQFDDALLASVPSANPFHNGDAAKGKETFVAMGCASCHTTPQKKAVSVGPDFGRIGAYRNWTWLAESIVNPSGEVGANWKNTNVYLKSGDIASGVLRENSSKQVKLLVGYQRYETHPMSEVEKVEIVPGSRMPSDYTDLLTFNQLSDIIAYLESLKGQAPAAGK